jgi:hypothetical protein
MTGEMSYGDIRKGGEHYEWAQDLKFASLRLMRMTKHRIKLVKVRAFDVYQGPYADLCVGRLWTTEVPKCYFFEGLSISVNGTLRMIADEINKTFGV